MVESARESFDHLLQPLREPPHSAFAEPLSATGPIRDTAAAHAFEQQAVERLNALTVIVKAHNVQSAPSPVSRRILPNPFGTPRTTQGSIGSASQHSSGGDFHASVAAMSSKERLGLQFSRQQVPTITRHDFGLSGEPERRGGHLLIEEVENVAPSVQQDGIVPYEDLLLICSTYCKDSSRAPCARHDGAFPGASYALQFPQHSFLYNGWAPPAVQAAAEKLLGALAEHWTCQALEESCTPLEGHTIPDGRAIGRWEDAKAQFVLAYVSILLRQLARVLVLPPSAHDVMVGQTYSGPTTYQRAVAARQTSWFLGQIPEGALPSVYDAATPILLRAGIDPSFAVRFQLLWGVQRLLTGVPAVHVGGESELWREMLKKVLASCDDALWPFAARTACVVGLHLQGAHQVTAFVGQLARLLLPAGRRFWDSAETELCLTFIREAFIFPSLGLEAVLHFSCLIPLLLEMAKSRHKEIRLCTLAAFGSLVQATWPRIKHHILPICSVLSEVHEDYGVADQDTNQAVVGLARTLHVLHHDGAPRGDNSWFLRFEQAV